MEEKQQLQEALKLSMEEKAKGTPKCMSRELAISTSEPQLAPTWYPLPLNPIGLPPFGSLAFTSPWHHVATSLPPHPYSVSPVPFGFGPPSMVTPPRTPTPATYTPTASQMDYHDDEIQILDLSCSSNRSDREEDNLDHQDVPFKKRKFNW
jgi:hypothetical protein